jgi:hypothetical protein
MAAINMKPRAVAIREVGDDAQLSLLAAIFAMGNSTCPFFISKLKTFDKTLLTAQKR